MAEAVTRRKSLRVVPTAHVFAGRGQTGALTVDLQNSILIEGHVGGMDAVKLILERPTRQLHVGVAELKKLSAGRGCPGLRW